jgi:hypothetical protein
MWLKLLIFLLFLAVVVAVGLLGYSYVGDMSPATETMSVPADVSVE